MGFRKGQGASEYLILLAVVLVVGMVAVTLLGGFTSMGGDARTKESKQYWAAANPFAITESSQQGSMFYVTLQNTEPDRLILYNITLSDNTGNITYSPPSGISFKGGQARTLNFTALRTCDATTYDFFEYGIKITYSSLDIADKAQLGSKLIIGSCVPS